MAAKKTVSTKAKGKKGASGKAQSKLDMRITLILFALIPLIVSSVIISTVLYNTSQKEMKTYTHDSLVQVVEGVGTSFDSMANTNKAILKAYTAAPIIKEALREPDNTMIQSRAQKFTLDYFGKLSGWEGLYLADWNSQVLTTH